MIIIFFTSCYQSSIKRTFIKEIKTYKLENIDTVVNITYNYGRDVPTIAHYYPDIFFKVVALTIPSESIRKAKYLNCYFQNSPFTPNINKHYEIR